MIQMSLMQVWALLTAAMVSGAACYALGVHIGVRISRRAVAEILEAQREEGGW